MSQISPLFFPSEKNLFIWIYLLKEITKRTKLLISPIWNKNLEIWVTISEAHTIEVQCSKNYFNFFYLKKLELLEITWKRNRKNHSQNKNKSKNKNEKYKNTRNNNDNIFILQGALKSLFCFPLDIDVNENLNYRTKYLLRKCRKKAIANK